MMYPRVKKNKKSEVVKQIIQVLYFEIPGLSIRNFDFREYLHSILRYRETGTQSIAPFSIGGGPQCPHLFT